MTYTVEYPSIEMRDAAAQMPMKEAMDAGYDKLAEYLANDRLIAGLSASGLSRSARAGNA